MSDTKPVVVVTHPILAPGPALLAEACEVRKRSQGGQAPPTEPPRAASKPSTLRLGTLLRQSHNNGGTEVA